MSHFTFLKAEWPGLHEAAGKAEALAHADPRAACFYARRALEAAMAWLYTYDAKLKLPYQDNLSALIHERPSRPSWVRRSSPRHASSSVRATMRYTARGRCGNTMGDDTAVELPGFVSRESFEKFRDKARAFLRSHQDHLTIRE